MIPDIGEQFHPFGAGSVIRAVVNNEYRFALVAGQPAEHGEQSPTQRKQQPTPVIGLTLEQLVSGVFAKWQFAVDHDAAEEVLTDKGQCENGFCQRAYTQVVWVLRTGNRDL